MNRPRPSAPPQVLWLVRKLEDAGYETWAVGGVVRDVLTGRPSGDWDFATRASPAQVRRVFRRTVPLGIEHGTVGVLDRDGTMHEVTTFRRDVETDGRHAVVTFAETIEEDLARRDFTVNALAWHPLREELLDPFGGERDLEAGILRTVGPPADRFREDYLRILRAFRFAGLLGLTIDGATWDALSGLVEHLEALSAERVREELLKVLDLDPVPGRALEFYAESGALRVLYPELDALRGAPVEGIGVDGWRLSVETVGQLPVGRPHLRLAALLLEVEREAVAGLLIRLRLSNARIDEIAFRAGAPPLPSPDEDDRAFRRWLSAAGAHRLAALSRLALARARAERGLSGPDRTGDVARAWRRARAVRAADPPLEVGDLALDGRGLIGMGLKPGPHFGRILESLLDWVLDDPTRNRREELEQRAMALASEEATDG